MKTYTKEERERQAIQAMQERLDYLRDQLLVGENISYAELAELQSLTQYIDRGDVQLLEAAGVLEFNI